jgi:hypothetical protein
VTGACQIGWDSPFEVSEHLSVAEELAEVDVEQMAGGFQHDVVVVSVADPQDVSNDAVAGARSCEVFDGSLVLQFRRVVLGQPLGDRFVLERTGQAMLHLDLPQSLGVRHHLDHACITNSSRSQPTIFPSTHLSSSPWGRKRTRPSSSRALRSATACPSAAPSAA